MSGYQLDVSLKSTANWGTSGNGVVTVTNTSGSALPSWQVKFTCKNFTIGSVWQASASMSANNVCTISSASWAQPLPAGGVFTSGFDYLGSAPLLIDNNVANNAVINGIVPGGTAPPTPPPPPPPFSGPGAIAGYLTEWQIYRKQPYDLLTMLPQEVKRVMYAFMGANPSQEDYNVLKANYEFPMQVYTPPPGIPEGTLVPQDTNSASKIIPQMQALKAQRSDVLLGVAIFGYSHSWNAGKIMANPQSRQTLVKSSVQKMLEYGFHVIELDWESPGSDPRPTYYLAAENEVANLLVFCKEMRAEIKSKYPGLLFGAAIAANKAVIDAYIPCIPYLDYINLMAYDYYGAWNSQGGHHAALFQNPKQPNAIPFFYADAAVQYLLQNQCPASKLLLGVPCYGRGWSGFSRPADTSIPAIFGTGTSGAPYLDDGLTAGVTSWNSLAEAIKAGKFKESWDDVAQAPYIYDSAQKIAWTYDNEVSAKRKAQYIAQNKLGGSVIWDLFQDSQDPNKSIVKALASAGTTPPPPPPPQTYQLQLSNSGNAAFTLAPLSEQIFSNGVVVRNSSGTNTLNVPAGSSLRLNNNS